MAIKGREAESPNTNNRGRGTGSEAGYHGSARLSARPNRSGRSGSRVGFSWGAGMHPNQAWERPLWGKARSPGLTGSGFISVRRLLGIQNTF